MHRGKEKSISRIGAPDDPNSFGQRVGFCLLPDLFGPGLECGSGHRRHRRDLGEPAVPGLAVHHRRTAPPPQLLDGDGIWRHFFVFGGVPDFKVPLPSGDGLTANKMF